MYSYLHFQYAFIYTYTRIYVFALNKEVCFHLKEDYVYHEKWKWLHTIFNEHPVIASNPGKRVFGKEAHVARCDEYLICLCSYIIYIIPISDIQETKINKKKMKQI